MLMKTLVKKSSEEIISAIPNLSDSEKTELLELETGRPNPRDNVLAALGVPTKDGEVAEEESVEGIDPEKIAEAKEILEKARMLEKQPSDVLDKTRTYGMVYYKGFKHYLQDGKVFDRASNKLIFDPNKD